VRSSSSPVPAFEQDRALLDRFRGGDSEVLAQIYYALVDDVFKLAALGFTTANGALRGERDSDEQRAIVQEVFVRAFSERARIGYDGLRPYRPYPLAIARNTMIDRARSRSNERDRTSDIDVDAVIAADSPIAGEIEESADQQRLRQVAAAYVASVDDAELRELIRLRFENEYSQAEVDTHRDERRRRRWPHRRLGRASVGTVAMWRCRPRRRSTVRTRAVHSSSIPPATP
jgi:DNA-directed RNA polymerase specialized sigma24 family protein